MLLPLVAGIGTISLEAGMLAVAAGGFLVWNFPSARIFMGDVGSGFLGYQLGVLALIDAQRSPTLLFAWAIILAAFITDATITVLRRLIRGERIYEAHRMHAYQRAARKLNAHWPVTLIVGAINLVWLLPWAMLVAGGRVRADIGVAAACFPIVLLVLVMGGGRKEA
jgi:Fuc2NAc and GlcNAc transferase